MDIKTSETVGLTFLTVLMLITFLVKVFYFFTLKEKEWYRMQNPNKPVIQAHKRINCYSNNFFLCFISLINDYYNVLTFSTETNYSAPDLVYCK
nr:hypothetical protein [Mycoplasmopsis bovis]